MSSDDLDEWIAAIPDGTPLARLADARLDVLPVDEDQVARITTRALRRLGVRPRRWPAVATGVTLAVGLGFALWARGPDRPAVDWDVTPAPLGPLRTEVAASADPELLAASFVLQGRPTDAMLIYRWLLANDPAGPRAATWQRALVDAATAAGDYDTAWTETLALRDRYGADTAWAARYGPSPLVDAALRSQAAHWHKVGRIDRAGVAYESYLANVPNGPDDDEVRYGYAELLWKADRKSDAWEQYIDVASRHPDSSHAKFCAESALFAAEPLANAEPADGTRLHPWQQRYLDSVDAYTDLYVDDPKAMKWDYHAGYLLYTHEQTDRAVEYFDRVIALAPDTTEASLAAQLILDGLEEGHQDGPMRTRAQSWLDAGWPEGELRERLLQILADER